MFSHRQGGLSLFEMLLSLALVAILVALICPFLLGFKRGVLAVSNKVKQFEARELIYHILSRQVKLAAFYPGLSQPQFHAKGLFLGVKRFDCGSEALAQFNSKLAKSCDKGSDILFLSGFNPRFLPVISQTDVLRVWGVVPRLKSGDCMVLEYHGILKHSVLQHVTVNDQQDTQSLRCALLHASENDVIYRYETHALFLKNQALYQMNSRGRLEKLVEGVNTFHVLLSAHFVEVHFTTGRLQSEFVAPNPTVLEK